MGRKKRKRQDGKRQEKSENSFTNQNNLHLSLMHDGILHLPRDVFKGHFDMKQKEIELVINILQSQLQNALSYNCNFNWDVYTKKS